MIPNIGEAVERLVGGRWVTDWMRLVRDGDRTAVLMWGNDREEYESTDVWRPQHLKEMPVISKYTNPQSAWLRRNGRLPDDTPDEVRGSGQCII